MADTFQLTNPNFIGQNEDKVVVQDNDSLFDIKINQNYQSPSPPKKKIVPITEDDYEHKEKLWAKILDKINFVPKDYNHYNNKSFLKPGFQFYKALAQCKIPPKNLKVKMPVTLVPLSDSHTLFYTNSQGCLERIQEVKGKQFDEKLNEEYYKMLNKIDEIRQKKNSVISQNDNYNKYEFLLKKLHPKENPEIPFVIQKGPENNIWETYKKIINFKDQEERRQIYDTGKDQIDQQFIYPQIMKASMMRLCYYTKNSDQLKSSYGYSIVNNVGFFQQTQIKITNPAHRFCTNSSNQDSFKITHVKGIGIKNYESQAEEMVAYLEKNYKVRIEQIVFDFVQDISHNIYLTGCRYIKLKPLRSMSDYLNSRQIAANGDNQLDQLTCSVFCKLCGISFNKNDASKIVTYKLLFEFQEHLKKRNVYLNDIVITLNTTRQCRVCNLCYMLVVQEHELIEVEQKWALQQKIPIYDPVFRVPNTDTSQGPSKRPALLPNHLKQWRILFYITEIQEIFNNYEGDPNNLYIQYKLFKQKSCWKLIETDENTQENTQLKTINYESQRKFQIFNNINTLSKNNQSSIRSLGGLQQQKKTNYKNTLSQSKLNTSQCDTLYKPDGTLNVDYGIIQTEEEPIMEQQITDNDITLKISRLHYFFSLDNDIQEFLNDSEIIFRITEGPKWENLIAEGKSKTMQHFKNKENEGQRHNCRIMLFFNSGKYCSLFLNSGIVQDDNTYNTQQMNLYKYKGVYFPDETYYNSEPLPDIWMELFDVGYIYRKKEIEQNTDIQNYQPLCNKRELHNMMTIQTNKNKQQFKNTKSRFKDTRSISYAYDETNKSVIKSHLPPKPHKQNKSINNTFQLQNNNFMIGKNNNISITQIQQDEFFQDQGLDDFQIPSQLQTLPDVDITQDNQIRSNQSILQQKKRRIQSAKTRSHTLQVQGQYSQKENQINISNLLGNSLNKYNGTYNQSHTNKQSQLNSTKDTKNIILGITNGNYQEESTRLEKLYVTDEITKMGKNKLKQIKKTQQDVNDQIDDWVCKYGYSGQTGSQIKLNQRPQSSQIYKKTGLRKKNNIL